MLARKSRISATNSLRIVRHMGKHEAAYNDATVTEASLQVAEEMAGLGNLGVRPGTINLWSPEMLMKLCRENRIERRTKALVKGV